MDLRTYSQLAACTVPDKGPEGNFLHAALGIGSESGEIVDIAKRKFAYNKPVDVVHAAEEIGDLMWYLNLCVQSLGLTWEQVLRMNIDKLSIRYPNLEYSDDKALNRDTGAEREALENAHDSA